MNNKKTLAQTTAAIVVARSSSNVTDLELSRTSKMRIITCEGIFPDYNKSGMQANLRAHVLHASISTKSSHKATFIGKRKLVQLAHKDCKGSK